jgi:hypothetical protein
MERRRFKQTQSLEDRLAQEALHLRKLAQGTPPGIKRQWLLRRARQCEIGSHVSERLRSPQLRPPEYRKAPLGRTNPFQEAPATRDGAFSESMNSAGAGCGDTP